MCPDIPSDRGSDGSPLRICTNRARYRSNTFKRGKNDIYGRSLHRSIVNPLNIRTDTILWDDPGVKGVDVLLSSLIKKFSYVYFILVSKPSRKCFTKSLCFLIISW